MSTKRKWNEKQLKNAVLSSYSYRSVLLKLDLKPCGGNYEQLKKYITEYSLDISHFTGQGWNKDRKHPVVVSTLEAKLTKNSNWQSNRLRQQLIKSGMLEKKCSNCGGKTWLGREMPLELDHINGIKTDNQIDNLRLLCPNCHALTSTYRGKNIKK